MTLEELEKLERLLKMAINEGLISFWDHEDAEYPATVYDVSLGVERQIFVDHGHINVRLHEWDRWGI